MLQSLATLFDWFRAISIVISAILFVAAVRYIFITDAFGGYRKYRLEVYKFVEDEKKRFPKRWKNVLELIQSDEADDWKHAIILADGMFDDMLKIGGYSG